jgi:hypothetical protein
MAGITRYPINIDVCEREVVREIISDRRYDIPSIWQSLYFRCMSKTFH